MLQTHINALTTTGDGLLILVKWYNTHKTFGSDSAALQLLENNG